METTSFGPLRISGAPFMYRKPDLPFNGPFLPSSDQLSSMGYLQHMRSISPSRLAGGFLPETGCLRALFECRVDLFSIA
ncbi:hypothetical protein AB6A40_010464 [Gnathostoma spinigerum]|uniref:MAT1 C-terminal CAK anchor domain-containing protein n=1 Tax=Gnathostoma spinigerum TaxID=75299 RepID=A0ABD6EW83_9BILA